MLTKNVLTLTLTQVGRAADLFEKGTELTMLSPNNLNGFELTGDTADAVLFLMVLLDMGNRGAAGYLDLTHCGWTALCCPN